MHWLRSFLRGLSLLWHWLRAEYGFFRAHRPAYAPVTVPSLPPTCELIQARSTSI